MTHALIVEDDVDLLELLGAHLRRLGCSVALASSGLAGLASAASQAPDLAVIDVRLPDIDGREVIGSLRASARTAHCKVVITSVLDAHDIGADPDGILAKPFDRKDVDRVLRPLLVERGNPGS